MNTTNTTNESNQDSVDTFTTNPLGLAIGAALALTATFGILTAYVIGAGSSTRYWVAIVAFFIIATFSNYIVANESK